MEIKENLEVVKRRRNWCLVGAVDLGQLCINMEELLANKIYNTYKIATHCLQYMFIGFNGFCAPVPFYG